MTVYLTFALLWTAYMAFETYTFSRPQSRPHIAGFFITHFLLAPISFAISATSGVLRERITSAYSVANRQRRRHFQSSRKKLIG
jgi:hypothetical protein